MDYKKFERVSGASLLAASLALGLVTGCSGKKGTGNTFTGTAEGKNGDVTVEVVYENNEIKSVKVTDQQETEGIADPALEKIPAAIVDAQTPNVETVSGATITSDAIINATKEALKSAGVDVDSMGSSAPHENVPVTYEAGTYTGTAEGYNGPVTLGVTFSKDGIEDIEVTDSKETAHVGTVAYDILTEDAKEANGSGIDVVSGATFTSKAFKAALTNAAEQAKASDLDGFASNTVVHEAQDPIEGEYDVVVVGAGGAGMGAAAQAAQNGDSVAVLEENAEVGGNTLVSGGQFQAVMNYLVWDPANPDATSAKWDYDGKTYDKVKAAQGQLSTLKTILNWNEDAFDEDYFKDKEYVPGEIDEVSKAGVHPEYLETLKELKKEIQAYVDWADKKIAAGAKETDLTLFSTVNLHIFQTYYGGLRQSHDKKSWIYGDFDLVKQFCTEGTELKTWLEDQGAKFNDAITITLIGALWYRENVNLGGDLDGDGTPEAAGNWGTYFATTENTILNTSKTAKDNKIMTRTKAESLIVDNGKVTGVKAKMYDGTEVTMKAKKGVIMATGGFASNIEQVMDTNEYWDSSYITKTTQTTNRSSLVGDGIKMGEDVGAATTGLGYTQMMPISWVDNGDLAFGNGLYGVYINPTTGKRFVDESAERDVLSLGEFQNGISAEGAQGVFLEFTNADTAITFPYPYDKYEGNKPVEISHDDVEGRVYYVKSAEDIQKVLDKYGMKAKPEDIYKTIEAYDKSILAGEQPSDGVAKHQSTVPVGTVDENGNYSLEGQLLRIRVMAPSTHHTMGGLTVDTDRHVLDEKGNVIEGLYAAGEVTGGIHGGNRLGGNAIVEIFVSGRTAANTIAAENK